MSLATFNTLDLQFDQACTRLGRLNTQLQAKGSAGSVTDCGTLLREVMIRHRILSLHKPFFFSCFFLSHTLICVMQMDRNGTLFPNHNPTIYLGNKVAGSLCNARTTNDRRM